MSIRAYIITYIMGEPNSITLCIMSILSVVMALLLLSLTVSKSIVTDILNDYKLVLPAALIASQIAAGFMTARCAMFP